MSFSITAYRIVALLAMLGCSFVAKGQDNTVAERLMTRHVLRCPDVSYNCTVLIPQLHARRSNDTLALLMNYWAAMCNKNPLWYAYKILGSIDQGTFTEDIYTGTDILNTLSAYAYLARDSDRTPPLFYTYYGSASPGDSAFCRFISTMASGLQQRGNLTVPEKFFVDFYTAPDVHFYQRLQGHEFQGTAIGRKANDLKERVDLGSGLAYGLLAGIWSPAGPLKIVGNHPYIGLQLGNCGPKLEVMITISGRFVRSADTYFVRTQDSLFYSNRFSGAYIGFDGAYAILAKGVHRLEALAGLGYDNMSALRIQEDMEPVKYEKLLKSFNANFGLGYRCRFKHGAYMGIQAKYNFIHYNNSGGTDMSGNSITIGLVTGIVVDNGRYYQRRGR